MIIDEMDGFASAWSCACQWDMAFFKNQSNLGSPSIAKTKNTARHGSHVEFRLFNYIIVFN